MPSSRLRIGHGCLATLSRAICWCVCAPLHACGSPRLGPRRAGHNASACCASQVLDVNGLLIERSFTVLRNAHDEPVEPDLRVGSFHVYNRPGLQAFITMLMERFVVGVWSSARQHNLRGLVRHIFGAYEERLAFAWGQESCTYAGTTADNKPLFLKELGRVWAEPAFASFGPHNTLLVDDDAYKAARNPPNTAIHPKKVRRLRRRRPLAHARMLRTEPLACRFPLTVFVGR